jgi:ribosomal protein S18 acetylase RimI-like enzyme
MLPGQFLPKYHALTESSFGKGIKHDSWQIQLVGTKPDCQKKGLATALLNFIQEKVLFRRIECPKGMHDPHLRRLTRRVQ